MNIELLQTITILYVEDEDYLRDDIFQNISPFVKKIIKEKDGKCGLETFLKNKDDIDLIITDILMPNMNGIEMVDEIRKLDKNLPIIYTTAFNDTQYMKKTIEQSVVDYILKPIDIELLLNGIEKASFKIENERLKLSLQTINQKLELKIAEKTKELQQINNDLHTQLYSDELTSLLNRKSLLFDIKKIKNPILYIVDIDSFKSINDLYGEIVGNDILIGVSKILMNCAKKYDYKAYRIGSDEFALLKDEEFDIENCEKIINSIVSTVNGETIFLEDYNISLRVDVTVAVSKEKEETIEKANMALKKAKKMKYSYLVYNEEHNLNSEYKNDIKWTKIIEKAIANDNIVAFYQPILNRNQEIIKYECLIRIKENDVIHSPFLFLDIAKKVKFYPQLTKIIISKAFKKAYETNIQISVNLSIEDILNPEIIKFIKEKFERYNVAHLIVFEILESENITDYEKVIGFIDIVKGLGCRIAIDDFGSGYSNFAYLLKLKPDYIKIDGSCVKNIFNDKNSYLITKTINDFAHSLGIKTIAEFVHNEEVFDTVFRLNVDEFQGYYFAEPKLEF